jgi:hypothetical protein
VTTAVWIFVPPRSIPPRSTCFRATGIGASLFVY